MVQNGKMMAISWQNERIDKLKMVFKKIWAKYTAVVIAKRLHKVIPKCSNEERKGIAKFLGIKNSDLLSFYLGTYWQFEKKGGLK